MNTRQAEQKLRELMKRKPAIDQPGRLLAHLLNELKVEADSTRARSGIIENALEKLEEAGIVTLGRTGNVLNSYKVTEAGAAALRANRKRVTEKRPASKLPVTVPAAASAQEAPAPAEETAAKVEVAPAPAEVEAPSEATKLSRHEMVTMALHVLQEESDDDGHIYVPSSSRIIAQALGLSKSEADGLNFSLGELRLRTSPRGRNDDGRRPHWVSKEIKEVTEEMLTQAGKKTEQPRADSDDDQTQVGEAVDETLVEIITGLEQELAEVRRENDELRGNAQATDELVEIITGLEATKAELEQKLLRADTMMQEGSQTLQRLSDEVERLTGELESTRSQLTEANAKLVVQYAPSAKAQEVLRRYGKS